MSGLLNLATYCLAENDGLRRDGDPGLVFADLGADGSLSIAEWNFQELRAAVLAVAAGLRDFDRGERVLVRLEHGPEFAFVFFGAVAAGLVPVPVSPRLSMREVQFLVEHARPALVCSDPALPLPEVLPVLNKTFLELKRDAPLSAHADTRANDPAFLIYTSGTTGEPKGVLHAHRSILGRRPIAGPGWIDLRRDDRLLHAGQLNWTYSLGVGLMDSWAAGATAILVRSAGGSPAPDVWPRLIQELDASLFAAVPSLYRRILKYGDMKLVRDSRLRHGLTAGEALSPELYAAWKESTRRELYEALGMSEVSTYISSGPAVAVRPGMPGRPQPGRRVTIQAADESGAGLLAVHRSDPGLMLGYWRGPGQAPELPLRDGEWFCGGDRASFDPDGYVHYHGRADDVMNAFGYRVAPLEVERALLQCELIAEVAVREVRVRDLSMIGAFVVPSDDARAGRSTAQLDAVDRARLEEEILAFARENLADYKCPRVLRFLDALPRTANGKVKKGDLPELNE